MARYKTIDTSPRFLALDLRQQLVAGTFEQALDWLVESSRRPELLASSSHAATAPGLRVVEEVPGVNCQGSTREELVESLHITLAEAIEFNRIEARSAIPRHTEINNHLARKICRDLGVAEPDRF